MSFCLISNLENFIKKKENNIPTTNASITSENDNRNIGNKNIKPPELINNGGKIIFLIEAGFSDALILTNIIDVAIIAAIRVLKIKNNGLFKFKWSIP